MPASNTSKLIQPILDPSLSPSFQQSLNDRLRQISLQLNNASAGTSTTTTTTGTSGSGGELILSVAGTLAILSDAAPATVLSGDTQFSTITMLAKTAPLGSSLTAQLFVAGVAWGPALTLAAGQILATFSVSATIAANALIRLDITGVGALLTGVSFPGSDLSVILW